MTISYPGGKGGSGVYQTIINQIPPHKTYIEAFAGGAAILRYKWPALASIAIDINNSVLLDLQSVLETYHPRFPSLELIHADALEWLATSPLTLEKSTFVYADPPYLMETRSSQRQLYLFELGEREEHERLLHTLRGLKCMVALSGYPSGLYDQILVGWRKITFQAMTRGGTMATEVLWMNYPEPVELHDYRYLGENFRERERIKRKKQRWYNRLKKMPAQERYALLATIEELRG